MVVQREQQGAHGDAPAFDPLADGYFDDPYPQYALLREGNPVHVGARGIVYCFQYEDVRRVLIDHRNTSMDRSRILPPEQRDSPRASPPSFPKAILNLDSPDHTRLRRLLSRAFTPRKLDDLVPWMEDYAAALLADVERVQRETDEPVDLVAELAFPFPFQVISKILGMPDWDGLQVRSWAHAISSGTDPMVTREKINESIVAYHEIRAYVLDEVLPWKRANPADDLLSTFLAAEAEGTVSTEELLDNVALLYVAGHETTTGLLGNAILNLLHHRDQLEKLRADPSLLPNAVDELNRYDSSIQFAWRYVVDDLPLGETIIPKGVMAFVSCGSANRDPAHFGETADQLDITRSNANELLSYGAGMHFCLGAQLARREAAVVLSRLFERFPAMELAGDAAWSRQVTFRRLERLPVAVA